MKVTTINIGISIPIDQSMYPKKDGILILDSSVMDLTMKFGAFPIYVTAPKKTAPAEIAFRKLMNTSELLWDKPLRIAVTLASEIPNRPSARLKNVRYVGALSRNEDSEPVIQK
jgi:hypothetical protein